MNVGNIQQVGTMGAIRLLLFYRVHTQGATTGCTNKGDDETQQAQSIVWARQEKKKHGFGQTPGLCDSKEVALQPGIETRDY